MPAWSTTSSFFFEGAIRLTEGETLSFAEPASYDWARKGRFFKLSKLQDLGEIYLHKVRVPDLLISGKERGGANEIALGEDVQRGIKKLIYVTRPLKYKGFELYRDDKDGYSPLFVLRDMQGKVLFGAYAPLQSIAQKDGTYLYRSGTATAPESFDFPHKDSRMPAIFKLQTTYYPDKVKKTAGEVLFQVWQSDRGPWADPQEGELFKGKAALGQRVKAGDYLLSMDEVRYWTSMKVIYRPGVLIIFISFWLGLGGITLSTIMKMTRGMDERKQS